MLIAALTIAKTWKHLKCPLMDKEDLVHIYNGILLIHWKKKNEIMPFWAFLLLFVAPVFLSPPAPGEQAQQHHNEEQQEDDACDSTHPVPP